MFECNYKALAEDFSIGQSVFDRLLELNPNRELIEYDAKKPIYQQVLDRAIALDREKSACNILETNATIRLLLSFSFETAARLSLKRHCTG